MARSWRDYARPDRPDKRDNRDERSLPSPRAEAFVPNVPNVTGLPSHVRDGLIELGNAPAPPLLSPELWPIVVDDARRLASEGWALNAIKLGWSALDLFGAVTDKHGDPEADGLAVKLSGRPLLALCTSFATVSDGPGARSFIYRGNNDGAVLLWEFGQRDAERPKRNPRNSHHAISLTPRREG